MEMRQLTRETRLKHWCGILQNRAESGMSIRGYCREHDINEKSYYYWQRRLRETAAEMAGHHENTTALMVAEPTFAELHSNRLPSTANITIRIGTVVVEIEGHADSQTVEAILRALC